MSSTPRMVAVLADIEANIARMADYAKARGKSLRPHAKTHKSPDIAKLQMAAGAIGISCATVSEMEAMAAAGISGLLLTSPIAARKTPRVAALHGAGKDVMAVVDSIGAVEAYAAANAGARSPLRLLVDIDIGHRRTGTQTPADTVAVAKHIGREKGLVYAGVQAYAGHAQHVDGAADRWKVAETCAARLTLHLEALKAAGLAPEIVTGSGTGCFADDMEFGLYTEFQVGSYVVMDTEYAVIERGKGPLFIPALFVEATVICGQFDGFVLVDAGHKALFRAGPIPVVAGERGRRLRYEFMGDEHGRLVGAPADLPAVGETLRFVLPHCDPNVVLFDHIDVERDGKTIAQWPVTARGVW
ncbi:MAG: alanine racemase [Rhodospirillaceae bacterium]